jgi:hypothetical protein
VGSAEGGWPTLVEEQAKVCQRPIRLGELSFPELGELFDDPTCRSAREVLRIAPVARAATRRRTSTLANANGSPGHRRLGTAKAERLQAAAASRHERVLGLSSAQSGPRRQTVSPPCSRASHLAIPITPACPSAIPIAGTCDPSSTQSRPSWLR